MLARVAAAAALGFAALVPASVPASAAEPPPETACLSAIRAAERNRQLPGRLLLAIGITESGRQVDGRLSVWPWTVNAEGEGRFFPDKQAAIAHVRSLRARDVRSIDVGCMQVNLQWHPDAFPDLETALDPAANVAYAAGVLKGHHETLRNWSRSVRQYHSATPELGNEYLGRVAANLRLVMRRRGDLADAPVPRAAARRPVPAASPPMVFAPWRPMAPWALPSLLKARPFRP